MDFHKLDEISPFVRMVKIKKTVSLTGTWEDIDHVLIYLAHGYGKYIVDGVHYSLKAGDVIIMPPYAKHIIMIENEKPTIQYILHFDFFSDVQRMQIPHQSAFAVGERIEVPAKEELLEGKCFVATVPEKERFRFENQFLSMYGEFAKRGFASDVMLRGMAIQFLVECFRLKQKHSYHEGEGQAGCKSWKLMEQALEYIYLHYQEEDINNTQIAEAVQISPNYLSKLFQKYLGMSLHKYLVSYRIEMAQRLIMKENYNITEAALASGFTSIHAFSKSFKQKKGISPSEYISVVTKVEDGKEEERTKEDRDDEDYSRNRQIYYNQ
ncbi:MAG: AraC family transcriptional regulator [Blautia sp.]